MRQRRILVLSDLWLPFPGGAERLIYNLARDLQCRGHEVRVVTGYPPAEQLDGPPLVALPIPLDTEGAELIADAARFIDPDVILTHHLYADRFWSTIAATGRPVVRLHYHGPRPDGAALVVHISEHVARAAGALGCDMVITPPAFEDVVAGTHGDAIGFVKPYPHKGAELLYEVARLMPDRRFVVLRGEWQTMELIERIPNVDYMEPVVDMRDFYREVRLVLMPSLSEDAGTVAQEATANGIPCVSSNVEGLAETNAGGIQLPPGLPQAPHWVASIRYLDDPEHYRDVVRSQREARPDWDALLAELSARIESL